MKMVSLHGDWKWESFFGLATVGETVVLCKMAGRRPMNADRLGVYMWFDLRKKKSRLELRDSHQEEIRSDWDFLRFLFWRYRWGLNETMLTHARDEGRETFTVSISSVGDIIVYR